MYFSTPKSTCNECGKLFAGSESGYCKDCHLKIYGDLDDWQEHDEDDYDDDFDENDDD